MQPDPRIGTEIGRYHLEGVLGRGGMGVVYRARQHTDQLERTVALKLLASELSTDEHFRQRFIRESRLASEIDHENIVPIYDAGEVDGQLYIVMRFVDGYDLASLLTREYRLDVERALRILGQAARALDAAHRKGLVHRDVKPGNILIASGVGPDASDHVYLADFGLTKRSASQSGLTKAGHFLGTLDYVAPEQIAGQAVDGAVDLYALGCVLFQCLAGIPPFVRDSDVVLLNAHLHDRPTALSRLRPELGAAIDAVIERALAKDPRQRYATCRELILAARAALASPVTAPLPPRPPLSTPPPAPRRATPRPGTARPPRPVAADGWLRTNGLLVAIGAAALVASVIFGVVVFNALGTGGTAFESAAGSPRPSLSLSPATPPPTSASDTNDDLNVLLAAIPDGIRDSCEASEPIAPSILATMNCFPEVVDAGTSYFVVYELYESTDALAQEYDSWLSFRDVTQDQAPCFEASGFAGGTPCEEAYARGGEDAGRILIVDIDGLWMYWTHGPTRILGTILDEPEHLPGVFNWWRDEASAIDA